MRLELKLIADVGLVGLPNAGKSTFLSVVSQARPKIANYPFTTLAPNLGVADFDGHSLVIADIPGLIEGAARGKGLGHEFLRHVERTAVLLHLIDATNEQAWIDYQTVLRELAAYSPELKKRPQLIALTKTDALDPAILTAQRKTLEKRLKQPIFVISSVTKQGVSELLRELRSQVVAARAASNKPRASKTTVPILKLGKKDDSWKITKTGNGFIITGRKIERFALRTDVSSPAGVTRLRDIMRKMGIMHELARRGAKEGDALHVGVRDISY